MIVKDLENCRFFHAMDRTCLAELLHPERDDVQLPYSIAHALLPAGAASLPHRLKTSSEVYLILEGEGLMHIDSEVKVVRPGQAILIPPGSSQHLKNTGESDLKFICIVNPFWRAEDEEIVTIMETDKVIRAENQRK